MFKNIKRNVILVVMVILALGNTLSITAAAELENSVAYSGYVKSGQNYAVSLPCQTVYGEIINQVDYIDSNHGLCCWANDYLGVQITEKVHYSATGTYCLTFNVALDETLPNVNSTISLIISTQLFEFSPVYTSGTLKVTSL